MKKYILIITIILVGLSSYIIFQHQQKPTTKDIYSITEEWSPRIQEVYKIKNLNGDWIAFFRSEHALFVGRLEQNWLGQWKFSHFVTGDEQPLGSTVWEFKDGMVLGGSGVSEGEEAIESYFFGLIKNPNVKQIQIEVEGKTYKDIELIDTDNERVFLFRIEGDVDPHQITALDNQGKVIYKGQ
ncbi:hypothetical protein [Alkalibacillus aidingensis]|uniref:hypothetical protein n=1 Tax=Alkalibacillus aidingensis TaxID=2747607 RepID=UPI0016612A3F|nr:hypothetical protein [Alkalibacillus aidingensis]